MLPTREPQHLCERINRISENGRKCEEQKSGRATTKTTSENQNSLVGNKKPPSAAERKMPQQ